MFSRKNHAKILEDEFVNNIVELEQALAKARADQIRNEFQVRHFESEVKLGIGKIQHAEERLEAYKVGRDAAIASQPTGKTGLFARLGRSKPKDDSMSVIICSSLENGQPG